MDRPPGFVISVSHLLGRHGASSTESLEGEVDVGLDQVEYCGPAAVALRIGAMVEGIWIRGDIAAEMVLRCNRCLRTMPFDARATMDVVCGVSGIDDGVLRVSPEGEVDLTGEIRDGLCLVVPLVPLCSQACRGLCPGCGSDLNHDPCPGHYEASESPLASLGKFLAPAEETV